MEIFTIIAGALGIVLGGLLTFLVLRPRYKLLTEAATREADILLKNAKTQSETLLRDGQEQLQKQKTSWRSEEEEARQRLSREGRQADERLAKREEILEQKLAKADEARDEYEEAKRGLDDKEKALNASLEEQNTAMEKIAKLSPKEAKEQLLASVTKQCDTELAEAMRRKIESVRNSADEEASNILVQSIQRYASSVTAESTLSVVKLESDDIKGKIIGREGRNINAFELITGTDLIIDDTPGAITISCFDMFRRFIAKVALEELIKDGRIHPSRIEDSVKKAQEHADRLILDFGNQACQELGISGFPEPVLKLIGRLRFRTSYGQNVLRHSIEVAYLAAGLAEYLPGADVNICKKAGLVHDLGKAVTHEIEGGHAVIGMEILQKFGVDERVTIAMKSHHEDFPYESLEARIVQAADAISASRPGARRETMEKYIKRLKELESIASSFEGVEKVFAIQAGREVRVFVNSAEVDDLQSEQLSFNIARKIEHDCQYPGEVRVAVIRESRFEGVAK